MKELAVLNDAKRFLKKEMIRREKTARGMIRSDVKSFFQLMNNIICEDCVSRLCISPSVLSPFQSEPKRFIYEFGRINTLILNFSSAQTEHSHISCKRRLFLVSHLMSG